MHSKQRIVIKGLLLSLVFSFILVDSPSYGQKLSDDILKNFHFRSIGPTRQGGRITDIAVPDWKKQPYTFYVGCTGGLWKTTNYGNSFEPIFDDTGSIVVGDVAVSLSNPNIVWVGTGEANFIDLYGDGVYKSIDGGQTWTNMGLEDSRYIGRIRIHPENPDVVYVAALGYGFSDHPERGVYKTEDGGKTWTKSLKFQFAGRHVGAVDLVIDPSNPDVLFAAVWDREDDAQGEGSGVYKTENAGRSWTKLGNGLPLGKLGRIGIDLYPKDPKILYATVVEPKHRIGIYGTEDGGKSWVKKGEAIRGASFRYRAESTVEDHQPAHTECSEFCWRK